MDDSSATRAELVVRLSERRVELEQAVLTRISEITDPCRDLDPEYVVGFPRAVGAALDFWLAVIDRGDMESPAVPADLLIQARLAARSGIRLETVLRRYAGGYALMDSAFNCAAQDGAPLPLDEMNDLVRVRSAALDRVLTGVSEEYERQTQERSRSGARLERDVRQILTGSEPSAFAIEYDFSLSHVALVARGSGAKEAVRRLAHSLDSRPLLVEIEMDGVWAWLGRRREFEHEQIETALGSTWPSDLPIAMGVPEQGLRGWRLSHRQARAAFLLADEHPGTALHYRDVCLTASNLQDDLLVASLGQLYLEPLKEQPDQGKLLIGTLGAYFRTRRSATSTAAALGVTRQTVTNRLRLVEERVGQKVSDCAAGLEAALAIDTMPPD